MTTLANASGPLILCFTMSVSCAIAGAFSALATALCHGDLTHKERRAGYRITGTCFLLSALAALAAWTHL